MPAAYTETVATAVTRPASTGARLDFLDALRGVAAMLVVIQHVGERYTASIPWFAQNWFSFGRLGVSVFFLVSGFVIPYAFEKGRFGALVLDQAYFQTLSSLLGELGHYRHRQYRTGRLSQAACHSRCLDKRYYAARFCWGAERFCTLLDAVYRDGVLFRLHRLVRP